MATEYKLSYTASDINERLGKVGEIDTLKNLVGTTPVSEQISAAIADIDMEVETDTTLKVSGVAADAKAVGDAIANVKVETDTTLKVSGSAADAKVTGDAITNLNSLVGTTPVADQIAEAIVEVYVQDEEPTDATNDSIWVDTSSDGLSTPAKTSANVYVEDARTTDVSNVDFSKYSIGDIVIVTIT